MKKIFLPHIYIFISLLFIFPTLSHSQTSEIPLKKGWNIIFLVNPTQSKAVEEVLESIDGKYRDVWEYDPANSVDPWKHYHPQFSSFSDLKEIGLNKKYWIYALQDTVLVIEELDTTPPSGTIYINASDGQTIDSPKVTLKISADSSAVLMRFSEDNVTWTEPEPFKETKEWEFSGRDGLKTIYVKFADSIGNWSTAAYDTIILNRGLIIGSEGGEVFSSDKKIKVTIPPGALYNPTKISILNLDKIEFLSLAPKNTAIMSIVECLPYGLTFQKPVSLTYFFDEAEVPGTLMQLGLYNALQKKIELSGKSAVGVNGDKVTFTLSHFSTYAALKNLVSGGAPIGGGVQIPLPDMFTGAFSHAIPISVAPARAGMQPQISLKYHSSNANSWLGVGFDLNPGYIVRSTKNGFPAYDDVQDIFLMVTDAGTTELVHLTDNVYQAKVESDFTKFFKETNDSWRAVRKNGTILRFGENDPSKENFYFGTYKWNVTEIADPNRNYISYSYIKENTKSYLYSISYGGNKKGYSHKNKLVFTLESREDIFSSYLSGGGIITQKRLKNIQITVLENILWTYKLEYVYSAETGRSLLTYVRQTAGNGEELPARKFNY